MTRFVLTAVPFVWIILCLPLANRAHPFIFGIPFLAFWTQLGVLITVFCIHALYTMDKKKMSNENSINKEG